MQQEEMYDFANRVRESARSLSCVLQTDCKKIKNKKLIKKKKIVPVSHCTCKHVSTAEERYDEHFI